MYDRRNLYRTAQRRATDQVMKRCSLARTDDGVPLSGKIEGTPWESATPITIDEFPWDVAASKQATVVRPLYDADTLYLQYRVEDSHSYAATTELNGPVWEDSCVELFATVEPRRRQTRSARLPSPVSRNSTGRRPHYFNFEVNCVGTVRLGFGPDRDDREVISADLADSIRVETSVEGPTKAESRDDKGWWVAVALPFETLAAFTGTAVTPTEGTVWRGNFHRLGGTTDPQYAAWNSVDAPEPEFHCPSAFGRLVFE